MGTVTTSLGRREKLRLWNLGSVPGPTNSNAKRGAQLLLALVGSSIKWK